MRLNNNQLLDAYRNTGASVRNVTSTHGGTMSNISEFEEKSSYFTHILGEDRWREMLPHSPKYKERDQFHKYMENGKLFSKEDKQ